MKEIIGFILGSEIYCRGGDYCATFSCIFGQMRNFHRPPSYARSGLQLSFRREHNGYFDGPDSGNMGVSLYL